MTLCQAGRALPGSGASQSPDLCPAVGSGMRFSVSPSPHGYTGSPGENIWARGRLGFVCSRITGYPK